MRVFVIGESMKGYIILAWSYLGKICKEKISVWGYIVVVLNNKILFVFLLRILVFFIGCVSCIFFEFVVYFVSLVSYD